MLSKSYAIYLYLASRISLGLKQPIGEAAWKFREIKPAKHGISHRIRQNALVQPSRAMI